jgi:tRNA(fMet)-specific endonuclease VapC
MKFFVDTSIFVDCLRKNVVPSSKYFLESFGDEHTGFTSSITVAELSVGAHPSQRSDALEMTLDLLSIVEVISVDEDVAIKGGEIYSHLAKNGEAIELNDCLIAATSLYVGINEIVTRNIKHFERIKAVEALTPEDIGF